TAATAHQIVQAKRYAPATVPKLESVFVSLRVTVVQWLIFRKKIAAILFLSRDLVLQVNGWFLLQRM
ncbi:unnamed protein product, partial [Allacma fusca]